MNCRPNESETQEKARTAQGDWPGWFRALLKKWLDLFHVHFRPDLLEHLRELDAKGVGKLTLVSVARRYAYMATFRKSS